MSEPFTDAEVDHLLERFDQTEPALQRKIIAQFVSDVSWLRVALSESVKLQAHYAGLLNDLDGGKRTVFENAQEWVDRLVECETIPYRVKVDT